MKIKKIPHLKYLLILATAIFAYAFSLGNGFVWDDDNFIVKNDQFKSVKSPFTFFTDNTKFCQDLNYQRSIYRPLRTAIFWASYQFFGLNPLPLHIFSLLIHLLNAWLAFFLIRRITGDERISFISALIFAVHPAFSEAIFSINYLADPLFTFFVMLAIIFSTAKRYDLKTIILILSAFIFALFSKETALAFVAIYIFYFLVFERERILHRKELCTSFALIVIAILYLIWRKSITGSISQIEITPLVVWNNLYLLPIVFFKYLYLVFTPYPLSAWYEVSSATYATYEIILAYTGFLLLLAVSLVGVAHKRAGSFFVLWFFAGLAPVMNFLPVSTQMAERFLYFPAIGMIVIYAYILNLVSTVVFAKVRNKKLSQSIPPAAIIFVFMLLTVNRGKLWGDEVDLFRGAISKYPSSKLMHINLGVSLYEKGRFSEAIPNMLEGIKLGDKTEEAFSVAGFMLVKEKRFDEAQIVSKGCLRYYPASQWCLKNLKDSHLNNKSDKKRTM
jgi:protein O-mannosyl-transferase